MKGYDVLRTFVRTHIRLLSYLGSAFLVTVWTVLRFFNRQTIFDLIGQQVLAGQWLQGHFGGTNIGVTNYLLKIVFLYMPVELLPGSERLKLILLTVIVNIVTIVLLGIVLEKILREFKIRPGAFFYGALLWLAAIAGSVFWIQFTNSRNLEIVGGAFLLYLGLRYLRAPSWELLAGISAFCCLLFFADTLQFFMTAAPLLIYAALQAGRKRAAPIRTLQLAGGIVVGFAASKLLFIIVAQLFTLTYLQADSAVSLSVISLIQNIGSTAHALAQLFSGAADAGKIRMGLNLLVLALGLTTFIYLAWRRHIPRTFALFVGSVICIDCLVFIGSGQAQQSDTARYLIMTAPMVVLAIGSLDHGLSARVRRVALCTLGIVIVANTLLISTALARNWDTTFPKDAHLTSVSRYLAAHPDARAYASMDTAMPLTYFDDPHAPLPLSCGPEGLIRNRTFYNESAYTERENRSNTVTLIILDGDAIRNTPHNCSKDAIIAQFGQPQTTSATDDGSIVLHYEPNRTVVPTIFN